MKNPEYKGTTKKTKQKYFKQIAMKMRNEWNTVYAEEEALFESEMGTVRLNMHLLSRYVAYLPFS